VSAGCDAKRTFSAATIPVSIDARRRSSISLV